MLEPECCGELSGLRTTHLELGLVICKGGVSGHGAMEAIPGHPPPSHLAHSRACHPTSATHLKTFASPAPPSFLHGGAQGLWALPN